jgi:hypothetical protein
VTDSLLVGKTAKPLTLFSDFWQQFIGKNSSSNYDKPKQNCAD